MGLFGHSDHCVRDLQALRAQQRRWLLCSVVAQRLLDQLQYHRSGELVGQSLGHSSWSDIPHTHMAVLLDHAAVQRGLDMGQ